MVSSSLGRANGYQVDEITLYPYDSDIIKQVGGINIIDLVSEFSIVESIHYFGMSLKMTIVDGVSIMEKFQLSGNEKIKIRMSKFDKSNLENDEVSLEFIVTEYPLHTKSANKNYQIFNVEGVSNHIFLDNLLKISQYMTGSPTDIIKNILINHLKYDESKITNDAKVNTLYDYIVPNIPPTLAIRHILLTACDTNLAPIMAWDTLKGFNIRGYSDMLLQTPYKDRQYKVTNFSDNGVVDESLKYLQEITSVLEFSSNLKMSKIRQSVQGAYASTAKTFNYATKEYSEVIYDATTQDDNIRMSKNTSFAPQFLIDDRPLNTFNQAIEYDIAINNEQTQNTTLNGKTNLNSMIKHSYVAQAEHMTHLIKLNGDFDLSAGKVIELVIPTESNDPLLDHPYFTGKYLVSAITHNFSDSYTMQVKLQKDGIEGDLSS